MAASSISMAAATSATSTLVRHRLTRVSSFDYSTITRILIQKSNSNLLRLKTQNPFSPLLPLLSHSHLCHSSSTFDNFEYTEDSESNLEEDPEDEVEEEEQRESLSVAAEERRLYVGNLPYAMTSSQLAEIFGESGRIDSIEIVYDRVTDRSRGFGFVTMGSPEEAKEAIRMFDGSQVGGRTVKVNFPEVPRGGEREVMGPKIRSSYRGFVDSPYKIYAGNLSWNLTSAGLRDAFADQPGLLSAKIIYDRDSGKSRGYGFVSFASSEEAQAAIDAINGVEVEGRPLRLNMAEGRTATSSSTLERSIETDLKASEMVSN